MSFLRKASKFGDLKRLVTTLAGQVGLMALNIAGGVVAARLLGPDGRGVYAAVTMWPQLIAMCGIAGVGNALLFFSSQSGADRGTVYRAAAAIALLQTAVVMMLAYAILPFAMHRYGADALWLAALVVPLAFLNMAHMIVKNYLVADGNFSRYNFVSLLPQLLFVPLLSVLLVIDASPRYAVAALGLSTILTLIFLLPGVLRNFPKRSAGGGLGLRSLFGFSLRAAPYELSGGLAGFADKLVLVPIVPAAQLGLYTVAFSFSRLITIPSVLLSTLMYTRMLEGDAGHAKRLHDTVFRVSFALLAVILAALFLVDRLALTTVYGVGFAAAVGVFRILSVEAALSFVSQITSQFFVAVGRPGLASSVQGGYTLVYAAAIAVVAPHYGIEGTAMVLAVCSAIRCAVLLMLIPIMIGMPIGRLYPTSGDLKDYLGAVRGID